MWECLCDCGNTITVFGKYLDNGHVLSCGCIKSKGETKIKEILIKLNISFETQKTFNSCRFEDTNQLARFDFYLPDYNIIIEYKCNWKYKTYKNFLFYMFADKDTPSSNFVHSILTFGFLIWIIRFIYTLIYGIR